MQNRKTFKIDIYSYKMDFAVFELPCTTPSGSVCGQEEVIKLQLVEDLLHQQSHSCSNNKRYCPEQEKTSRIIFLHISKVSEQLEDPELFLVSEQYGKFYCQQHVALRT